MAWEMAHASKSDHDEAAKLRGQIESLADSKNPVRIIQRYVTTKRSEAADDRAESIERNVEYEVGRNRDKLHFYEQLKGSDAVHELNAASADRAEAAGLAELATVLRTNDSASAAELASQPHYDGHAAVDLIEQIGSHLTDAEQDETKVSLGFEDVQEALAALGFSESLETCKQKFDEGRSVLLSYPNSEVAIELAAKEQMVRKPGATGFAASDNYMMERFVQAFVSGRRS